MIRTYGFAGYLSGRDQLGFQNVYYKPIMKLFEDLMCAVIDSSMATYKITCSLFVAKLLFRYAILIDNLLAVPKYFISCFEWP